MLDRRRQLLTLITRVGVILLFVGMIVLFSALRPEHFPTWTNTEAVLQQAAVFAVLGAGLTIVLVINEFDLSFDANASLAGAVAVYAMTSWSAPTGLGIIMGVLAGAAVGVANGTLVAYGRTPAFISTLAVASVAAGLQSWLTDDQTLYGVPHDYIQMSVVKVLGLPLFVWVSAGCVVGIWGLLRYTVYGRHSHAVGANAAAAQLAGIRTTRVRWGAFVILGGLAGLAGVMITSQAGASSPDSSAGLLLPVYTAAFLGASAWGRAGFNALATYFGVIFIGTLSTGLTMLGQPAYVASLITGAVLIVAVLIARRTA